MPLPLRGVTLVRVPSHWPYYPDHVSTAIWMARGEYKTFDKNGSQVQNPPGKNRNLPSAPVLQNAAQNDITALTTTLSSVVQPPRVQITIAKTGHGATDQLSAWMHNASDCPRATDHAAGVRALPRRGSTRARRSGCSGRRDGARQSCSGDTYGVAEVVAPRPLVKPGAALAALAARYERARGERTLRRPGGSRTDRCSCPAGRGAPRG